MSTIERIQEPEEFKPRDPRRPEIDTPSGTLILRPVVDSNPHSVIERAMDEINPSARDQEKIVRGITTYKKNIDHYGGLSREQRRFLLHRILVDSDKAAADLVNVHVNSVASWRKRNVTFARAYAAIWVDPADFTESMLTTLLPKVVETLEDALEPETKMADRLKATEIIMRSQGMAQPERNDGELVNSAVERALAYQLLERGKSIPPGLAHYVEGESRVIDDHPVPDIEDESP
jgi:hypothetical protein